MLDKSRFITLLLQIEEKQRPKKEIQEMNSSDEVDECCCRRQKKRKWKRIAPMAEAGHDRRADLWPALQLGFIMTRLSPDFYHIFAHTMRRKYRRWRSCCCCRGRKKRK
ncbi:unnamed protein product [Linum trigynum]|uniref:Uncharacterized protein n=1 Tax=Linum trigynum TaxID=586398 RepID=A0AAV2G2B6_9ROSI